uniref:Complex III subunit 3 n=1 Tax=Strongyloides papillosus TaxID=174720 RepID=A0A0N5BTP1_STREA
MIIPVCVRLLMSVLVFVLGFSIYIDGYNILVFMGFIAFMLVFPYFFRDPEMFIAADPITRPAHIVPE